MIELRWYVHPGEPFKFMSLIMGNPVEQTAMKTGLRVLQYRSRVHPDVSTSEWTEWHDVPEVYGQHDLSQFAASSESQEGK